MSDFDQFDDARRSREQPAEMIRTWTPTDTTTVPFVPRAIMSNTDVLVFVRPFNHTTPSIGSVALVMAGRVMYPVRVTHIYTSGMSGATATFTLFA